LTSISLTLTGGFKFLAHKDKPFPFKFGLFFLATNVTSPLTPKAFNGAALGIFSLPNLASVLS